MSIIFGNVPYPEVGKSPLTLANPWLKQGAPAIPEAIVWHRMVGNLRGTDDWFHKGNAATSYGIGVGGWDSTGDDGRILEWISPQSGYYGESSGPVASPYGDGLAYVNEVGVNAVNRKSKAIEISGNYDTPLSDKARASIVALTAYWADQRRISYETFPIMADKNRSFVIWHQEITIGSGKICPGPVVMNETPDLLTRVKLLLERYQTAHTTPTYAKPAPISGDVRLFRAGNGRAFVPIQATFTLKKATPQYQYAELDGPVIGPALKAGAKVKVLYHVVNEGGEWFVSDGWARLPIGAFV